MVTKHIKNCSSFINQRMKIKKILFVMYQSDRLKKHISHVGKSNYKWQVYYSVAGYIVVSFRGAVWNTLKNFFLNVLSFWSILSISREISLKKMWICTKSAVCVHSIFFHSKQVNTQQLAIHSPQLYWSIIDT